MPHTVHLAALKVNLTLCALDYIYSYHFLELLESIGAVEKNSKKKRNYQESVTEPVGRGNDENALGHDDEEEEEEDASETLGEGESVVSSNKAVLTAVRRVCYPNLIINDC
jgi:hypothetical protein